MEKDRQPDKIASAPAVNAFGACTLSVVRVRRYSPVSSILFTIHQLKGTIQ
jgi:hypothetical protein